MYLESDGVHKTKKMRREMMHTMTEMRTKGEFQGMAKRDDVG